MNILTLILLFLCHFLADYTWLSTSWMLNAKKLGKPLTPILFHALIHALLMGVALKILYPNSGIVLWLIYFQFGSHFLIDVWKGRMNGWFPSIQSPANKLHWVLFGFDQFLHSIVILVMAYYA